MLFNMKKIFILAIILFYSDFIKASPTGKGLSCFNKQTSLTDYDDFRGLYFESNQIVRVVGFKNKNNSLKIVSKTTPYKISDKNIKFKVKFIWYGNISFENFLLDRDNLEILHSSNNNKIKLKCKIIKGNFMSRINEIKSRLQSNLNNMLEYDKI